MKILYKLLLGAVFTAGGIGIGLLSSTVAFACIPNVPLGNVCSGAQNGIPPEEDPGENDPGTTPGSPGNTTNPNGYVVRFTIEQACTPLMILHTGVYYCRYDSSKVNALSSTNRAAYDFSILADTDAIYAKHWAGDHSWGRGMWLASYTCGARTDSRGGIYTIPVAKRYTFTANTPNPRIHVEAAVSVRCLYLDDVGWSNTSVNHCFWVDGSLGHYAAFSTGRSNIKTGGVSVTAIPGGTYNSTAPYRSGNNVMNCATNVRVGTGANVDEFGYYRVDANYNYKRFTTTQYWMRLAGESARLIDTVRSDSAVSNVTISAYAVHTCSYTNAWSTYHNPTSNITPAQMSQNAYNALVAATNANPPSFDPADCVVRPPEICTYNHAPDIGNVGFAGSTGGNGGGGTPSDGGLRIMRDGKWVSFNLPEIQLVNTPYIRSKDGSAVGVEDFRFQLNPKDGSTPWNRAVGLNHDKQWFKWEDPNGQRLNFGQWYANPNAARFQNSGLRFYWSSDDEDSYWGVHYRAGLNPASVEYYVNTINGWEWRDSTTGIDCFPGSSSSDNDAGQHWVGNTVNHPSNSADIQVMRGTNNN